MAPAQLEKKTEGPEKGKKDKKKEIVEEGFLIISASRCDASCGIFQGRAMHLPSSRVQRKARRLEEHCAFISDGFLGPCHRALWKQSPSGNCGIVCFYRACTRLSPTLNRSSRLNSCVELKPCRGGPSGEMRLAVRRCRTSGCSVLRQRFLPFPPCMIGAIACTPSDLDSRVCLEEYPFMPIAAELLESWKFQV